MHDTHKRAALVCAADIDPKSIIWLFHFPNKPTYYFVGFV
jgi:hypothetical protein